MAYWTEKNGKKWLYHRNKDGKYIKPIDLGHISDAEADVKVAQYRVDIGKDPANISKRSMMSVFADYQKYMVDHDYSPQTLRTAPQAILPFIATVPTIEDLTEDAVRRWEKHLLDYRYKKGPKGIERKLSLDTRLTRMRTIKSFIGWMVREKIIKQRPCHIEIGEGRQDAGRDLSDSVPKFLDGFPKRTEAIAYLIFYAGLRVTAALSVEGDWINHRRGSITLPTWITKNKDPLEVFLPKKAMDILPVGAAGPLWADITPAMLLTDWNSRIKALGIKGRFRIHDGRVSAASEVWRKNKDVKLLMSRFGWRTLKTAMHYVKVTENEHREAAERITFGGEHEMLR